MNINTTDFHVLILCFATGLEASFVSLNKGGVCFCVGVCFVFMESPNFLNIR